MSISEEFEDLHALHENGTLTDAEFAEAKAKVLAEPLSLDAVLPGLVQQDIRGLRLQSELLRLDQDWVRKREAYRMYDEGGGWTEPNFGYSFFGAFFISIIGLVGVVVGGKDFLEVTIPVSLLMLGGGVWLGVWGQAKAKAYDAAYEQYQQIRHDLTDRLEALG